MPQTRNPTDPNQRETTVKTQENTKNGVASGKDKKIRLKAFKLFLETKHWRQQLFPNQQKQ